MYPRSNSWILAGPGFKPGLLLTPTPMVSNSRNVNREEAK